MDISIIGAGNMGGATALGLARFCPEARITVTTRHQETLEKFSSSILKFLYISLGNSLRCFSTTVTQIRFHE